MVCYGWVPCLSSAPPATSKAPTRRPPVLGCTRGQRLQGSAKGLSEGRRLLHFWPGCNSTLCRAPPSTDCFGKCRFGCGWRRLRRRQPHRNLQIQEQSVEGGARQSLDLHTGQKCRRRRPSCRPMQSLTPCASQDKFVVTLPFGLWEGTMFDK